VITTLAVLRWLRANFKILLWSLIAILAFLFAGWVVLTRKKTKDDGASPSPGTHDLGPLQNLAQERIADAETESHIESEIAKAHSEEQRAQLTEIKKVPDPNERRKALASWLNSNL
jgi:hypothetical protein